MVPVGFQNGHQTLLEIISCLICAKAREQSRGLRTCSTTHRPQLLIGQRQNTPQMAKITTLDLKSIKVKFMCIIDIDSKILSK
jgi:hypothetical protein